MSPVPSRRLLRAVGRHWPWLLVLTVLGTAGGFGFYRQTTPEYRTSVRLMVVSTPGTTPADQVAALADQRAQTLAALATSSQAVQGAQLAGGFATSSAKVTAYAQPNSPVLTVTVTDTQAQRAQSIADQFALTLPATLSAVVGPDPTLTIRTLAAAALPRHAYNRHLGSVLGIGAAVGLGVGLLFAFASALFDRRLRDVADMARAARLPVLGAIPRQLPKRPVPALSQPRSARAEAYRHVRTAVINARVRDLVTIVVTSTGVGDGKTSVACNLAAVLSRGGHRVVLVDADLRRPQVATFFALRPAYGLTDVLSGHATLPEAITLVDDGRLAVLTAGRIPANPSEALDSLGMEHVLGELVEHFDYGVIDTPPVLPVTDAAVLAAKVDGVLLVARAGHTTADQLRRARATLELANGTVLGVVANHAGTGRDREHRYPYRETVSTDQGGRRRREDRRDRTPVPSSNGHSAATAVPAGPVAWREPPR